MRRPIPCVLEDQEKSRADSDTRTNNVDAAHLLSQHHGEGGERGAADTGNGEELDEAGDVIGLPDYVGFFLDLGEYVV